MVRPLSRMGNPILRVSAARVDESDIKCEGFLELIGDLRDSMKHYGGIGIAAPQIGVSLQVCVVELMGANRYGENSELPFTVFINPEIEILDPTLQGFWEGCLSVPGLRGFVKRPRKIRVKYLNQKAQNAELVLEGFLATVIQHELDHLFGKLYVDRMEDLSLLTYQDEFEQFHQSSASID
jgi:peptide deformylase